VSESNVKHFQSDQIALFTFMENYSAL